MLLDAGAEVNANNGKALLSLANGDCLICLTLILKRGGQTTCRAGSLALKNALRRSSIECARLMVEYGVDPESTFDANDYIPYSYAKILHNERARFVSKMERVTSKLHQHLLIVLSVHGVQQRGICALVLSYAPVEASVVVGSEGIDDLTSKKCRSKKRCVIC